MINYQSPRERPFIMIGKGVDDELSPDAYFLLIKLMKLAPNESNSNANLREKTQFSKRRFDRAKAELIDKNYLETRQLYGNIYAFYIGKQRVMEYRTKHKKSDNRHERNQLEKIKNSLKESSK